MPLLCVVCVCVCVCVCVAPAARAAVSLLSCSPTWLPRPIRARWPRAGHAAAFARTARARAVFSFSPPRGYSIAPRLPRRVSRACPLLLSLLRFSLRFRCSCRGPRTPTPRACLAPRLCRVIVHRPACFCSNMLFIVGCRRAPLPPLFCAVRPSCFCYPLACCCRRLPRPDRADAVLFCRVPLVGSGGANRDGVVT